MIRHLIDFALQVIGAVVLVTYFIALYEQLNDPEGRPRIPVPRALWGMVLEFAASVANVLAYGAGFFDLDPWLGGNRGTPVLLVHGYGMNRACMFLLQFRLARAGYRVRTINLRPPYGDIRRLAEQAARALLGLAEEQPGTRVAAIGHSMGGLVLREACRSSPRPLPVSTIITIGTPHGGTKMAVFGLGEAAPMMLPKSSFLEGLSKAEAVPADRFAIWSQTDNLVVPARAGRWEGAGGQVFDHLGHLSLLLSAEVTRSVLGALPPSGVAAGRA